MPDPVKILVVGCGNMGKSHAKAYHSMEGYEIVGLVSRGEKSRKDLVEILGVDYVPLGTLHTYTNVWNETKKSCREK